MVHQERKKRKTLHTRNMNTWLLLYPTTKACFSLILHVHIFKYTILKCCLYRASYALLGEHSVCGLKEQNKKKKNGFMGIKVFLTMLAFVSKPVGLKVSAAL